MSCWYRVGYKNGTCPAVAGIKASENTMVESIELVSEEEIEKVKEDAEDIMECCDDEDYGIRYFYATSVDESNLGYQCIQAQASCFVYPEEYDDEADESVIQTIYVEFADELTNDFFEHAKAGDLIIDIF